MKSIQTKEVPSALNALSRAKGARGQIMAVASTPTATMVQNSITETNATPEEAPAAVEVQATPVEAHASNPRYSEENYLNLKAHHDKTTHELRQKVNQLEEALSTATAPKIELPKTKEEMEEFKRSNPDSYDLIRSIAMDAYEYLGEDVKKQVSSVKAMQNELKEREAFNKLLSVHPDAKEIRESPEFAKWYNDQPEGIKTVLANSNDVDAVVKLLTLYKVETKGYNPKQVNKAAQQERIDASIAVNVKGTTEVQPQKEIWTRSKINAISSNYKLWNQYREEIDNARREGRVDETK